MTRYAVMMVIGLGACVRNASVRPPEGPVPPLPVMSSDEFIDLHAMMRVADLDDRRSNHTEYWRAVTPYLGRSVTESLAGLSAEGREIRHLTFGSGSTTVLLWSQMHGNGSTASMALADIIRFFDERPDHALAQRIAAGATVHMIPMLKLKLQLNPT